MLLARLAVSKDWQGQGLGAGLLKDAMRRTLQAADIAGIRAFAVHAKDDSARAFYEHFGFLPSPTDPSHLFLLMKDLRNVAPGATGHTRNSVRDSYFRGVCLCRHLAAIDGKGLRIVF